MAELRSRFAEHHAAPGKSKSAGAAAAPVSPQPAQRAPSAPPHSASAPARPSEPRPQTAHFQGLSVRLGEPGNSLQGMAVLTHNDVRQLEEYGKNPLDADQRFLASLQKMAPAPQQRAAAIMQMAAGAVPPPAVLVWAAQEVVAQMRQLVRERLEAAAAGAEQEQQQQQGAAGAAAAVATALVSEPWYGAAVQLALLCQSGGAPALGGAATELGLLRAFSEGPPAPAAAGAPPPPRTESYIPTWEALLALPQLPTLLEAAATRSEELATVLELSGLSRPVAEAPTSAAAAAGTTGTAAGAGLLPALRSAAAAACAKALRAAGLAAAAEAPLDADAALTALALGTPGGAAATAEQRVAAADWLAAATLLRHAEERLGCVGGSSNGSSTTSGVRQEAVAALHLLGLPLEPKELPYMDELKVSEQELATWLSQLSVQLASGAARPDGAVLPVPPALESRLAAARQRLAASGRALVLAAPPPPAAPATAGGGGGGGSEPAWSPAAAATLSWLRAVGAPLASGLLSGGYGSLSRLRSMVPELREALVLRLLETGRVHGGTAALAAGLYGDAEASWRGAREDRAGADTAAALLHQEAVEAELDLLHERFVATPSAVAATTVPRPLPSDAALAAAVQALPPPARLLYDSYYVLRSDGGGDDAAVVQERRRVADALAAAGEGAVLQGLENLQAWLADARKGLLLLPPPLLALLLRFLRVQVSVTPEAAEEQRNKLTALALLVAEQQRRAAAAAAAAAAGAGGSSDDDGAVAAAAVAARELAEWSRGGGGGGGAGRVPAALAALLGPAASSDFSSWLQAVALSAATSQHSTQQLTALQHLEMDVQRYLTMTHDPRLDLPRSGVTQRAAASSSSSSSSSGGSIRPTSTRWTDPALRRSEAVFLEDMRAQLGAYLKAMGHRPLGDAEWRVYKDAALEEWDAGRPAREERLAVAGQSGFFNPRADEVYLQQMLEQGIPLDDPLGPQSRRYLDTLLRNPSWSFAQRRQAVQRLIQLNAHFARQQPAPEGGSPFAQIFAVGGPDVAPRLGPLPDEPVAAAAASADGVPGRGRLGRRRGVATAGAPLPLPRGF